MAPRPPPPPGSDGAASFPRTGSRAMHCRTAQRPCLLQHKPHFSVRPLVGSCLHMANLPGGMLRKPWIFGSTPFTGLPSQSWSLPPHFLLQKLLEFPASTEMQVPAPFVSPQNFELGDMKNTSVRLAAQPGAGNVRLQADSLSICSPPWGAGVILPWPQRC